MTPCAIPRCLSIEAPQTVMTEPAKVPFVQFLLPYPETASGLPKLTEVARHAFNAFALRMEIMAEDNRVCIFYAESNIAAAGSRID